MKLFRRSLLDRSFSTTTLRTMTVSYQMLILMNIVREHLWKKYLFRLVGTGRSPCWQLHWWNERWKMVRGFNFNFQLFCCVLYVFGNWFLPCLSTNPNEGRQCNLRSEICMLSIARGLRKSCSLFKKLSKSYLVRYLKWRWFHDHFINTRYYWFAFFFT